MALSTFIPLKTPIRMLSQTPLKALIRGLLSSVWWWLNGLWLLIWQANQRLARNVTYFFFREIWKDKCPKCLVKLSQLNNFRKEHVNPISNQLTHHLDRMRVKVLWSIPNTISNECGLTFKKKKVWSWSLPGVQIYADCLQSWILLREGLSCCCILLRTITNLGVPFEKSKEEDMMKVDPWLQMPTAQHEPRLSLLL